MIDENRKQHLTFLFIAIAFAVGGSLFQTYGGPMSRTFGLVLIAIHVPVFAYACAQLAIAKGYHWAVGLIGLASCVGYVVLRWALPDREEATWA